jgi:hypothetical protein
VTELISYHKIQHVTVVDGKVGVADNAIAELFNGFVEIEEKTDGSQFRIHIDPEGKATCGSRQMNFEEAGIDKNFLRGVDHIKNTANNVIGIIPNTSIDIFAEILNSPHHNTLTYGRVPKNHIMLFDVLFNGKEWGDRNAKKSIAEALEVEIIPQLWKGNGSEITKDLIDQLLLQESVLGKVTIEGIVFKNYSKFYNFDKYPFMAGKFLCGKLVRQEFKEANREGWASKNGQTIPQLIESLRTEARFAKAVQHLKDRAELTNTMRDLPAVIKEIQKDVLEEEGERLKEIIWNKAWGEIRGGLAKGVPEFYKAQLAKEQIA